MLDAVFPRMTPQELRDRTDRFSVDIIVFCRSLLPADPLTLRAQFVAKLSIAVEEADECVGWLHKLVTARIVPEERLAPIQQEASELLAILSASRKTASGRRITQSHNRR